MNQRLACLYASIILLFAAHAANFSAYNLQCEQLSEPDGIESPNPRFSWKSHYAGRNFRQGGYRILVASSPVLLKEGKADMWDSGNVASDQSLLISYEGKKLQSGKTYYWTVKIADADGKPSDYSDCTRFTTGLFSETDWHGAKWIAMERDGKATVPFIHRPIAINEIAEGSIGKYKMPQFRKEFLLRKKPLKSARAYVAGLGQFEFYVNGHRMGNHFLDAGWTKFDTEAQYVPFDITDQLGSGSNVLGVMLGNGFYNIPNERYYKLTGSFGAPKMRMVVIVEYTDGTFQYVISDRTWQAAQSPITYSSIYGGEDYDATREISGWMLPGFNARRWARAIELPKFKLRLYTQPGTHLQVRSELPVNLIYQPEKGKFIYDFGQNFSGIVRLKVKGNRGQTVTMRPGELLSKTSVNQEASGDPHYYVYTLGKTDVEESWQPRFSYYGLRYVQIEGAVPAGADNPDGLPEIIEVTGLHTTAALGQRGSFSCSNQLFNKTYNLIDWAMRSNMASVLTDCPHREKLGWQEQTHLMQNSLQYRYDMAPLYPKIMRDLAVSQWPDGTVPTIAPEYVRFVNGFEDTPEWGSAFIISPWYYYQWYGDKSLLTTYYPAMKRYIDYLGTRANANIVAYGLGDWFDIGPAKPGRAQLTSNGLTATAMYYYDVNIMRQIAELLGLTDDVQTYTRLAADIKKAYNDRFFNAANGGYERNSQTANAMSLAMGLVEPQFREGVLNNLVTDIATRRNALTAGDIGYRYVLRALADGGRSDVIFNMNSRYHVPGYGWQIARGATALTESWQAYENVSNNHFMLGHLMEWLFGGIGGIRQADDSVAFKHIIIDPQQCGDVNSASTKVDSPYGIIECNWSDTPDCYEMTVTIPANTTASVILPAKEISEIADYGVCITSNPDIKVAAAGADHTRLDIGSGTYRFSITR